jgi:hypothetical protein
VAHGAEAGVNSRGKSLWGFSRETSAEFELLAGLFKGGLLAASVVKEEEEGYDNDDEDTANDPTDDRRVVVGYGGDRSALG